MNYPCKQLDSNHLGLMHQLLKVFGDAFDDVGTYQGAVPSDSYLKKLLDKPHFITLVALHGNAVIGGLVAYVLEKFEQERSEIYIYDLAVQESYRRQGIATQLIKELQAIGKQKSAYVIFVQADKIDDPAIALYDSLGIQEDVYHYDISIT